MTRLIEILISLAIVAVLFVLVGLVLPSHRHLTKDIETNRKMTIVYDTLNSLKRFKDWNVVQAATRSQEGVEPEVLQQLFRRGNALGINFRALDDGDRQRRFNVGALDARSGHRHAIQSFDLAIGTAVFGVSLLRHDGHGQGGQQRKAQAAHMECGA